MAEEVEDKVDFVLKLRMFRTLSRMEEISLITLENPNGEPWLYVRKFLRAVTTSWKQIPRRDGSADEHWLRCTTTTLQWRKLRELCIRPFLDLLGSRPVDKLLQVVRLCFFFLVRSFSFNRVPFLMQAVFELVEPPEIIGDGDDDVTIVKNSAIRALEKRAIEAEKRPEVIIGDGDDDTAIVKNSSIRALQKRAAEAEKRVAALQQENAALKGGRKEGPASLDAPVGSG